MTGPAHHRRHSSPGYRGSMVSRVGAMVLMGVVMAGCGLSPEGTVKVDGDEYAKALKETASLGKEATDLIRDASDGTEGDISPVQSDRCGEPYADNLRQLELGSSFVYAGTSSEAEIIDSVSGEIGDLGWKEKQGENGRYRFEHGVAGGATLRLYVSLSGNADDQGRFFVRMSFESTCMKIPKDVAEKS